MKLPITLSFYIMRQFFLSLLIVYGALTILIILLDFIELMRRSHSKDVPIIVILQMVMFKFPLMGQKLLPFAMFISSVLTYTKLTRSNELVVVRSAGVSVWQFLMPSVLSAVVIGIFMVVALNPLACAMIAKYENLEGKFLRGKISSLDISTSGLWLRQKNPIYNSSGDLSRRGYKGGETIIHALTLLEGGANIELADVIIFVFVDNNKFSKRIDANTASLLDGFWRLKDTIITLPDGVTRKYDEYFLNTELTVKDIHDSFASPETISFWELPAFIDTLKKSGFSALPHQLHWHNILVSPLLYASMIFIAALFSLRPAREGKTLLLITGSIFAGFLIYFLTSLVSSFGLSGNMPIALAAWAPVITSMLIGIGFLLHFEDG